DVVSTAAKSGLLLSGLAESRQQTTLDRPQVQVVASAAGINSLELDSLLKVLQDAKLLNASDKGVDVLGVSLSSVLEHTVRIFDSLGPTQSDLASIDLAERVSNSPRPDSELLPYLEDVYEITGQGARDLLN